MRITASHLLLLVAAGLAVFSVSVGIAHAQYAVLVTSQDTATASSTGQYNTVGQGIGTQLVGTVTRIEWKLRGNLSAGGTFSFKAILKECTDGTYASCTDVGETQSDTQTWVSGYTTEDYAAQMVTSVALDFSKYYAIAFSFTGGSAVGTVYVMGVDGMPAYQHGSGQLLYGGSGITAAYYQLIGEFDSSGLSIGSATSSSMWSGQDATTTLTDLAQQCSQASNLFAEGLCIGFSFLFMPSSSVIGGYTNLIDDVQTRFPVSYVVGVSDAFDSLSASSTANMITVTLPFHSMNVGTSSPLGLYNIVSADVDAFSTSTIQQYIGSTYWNLFQSLIALAIWLTFAADVFFTVRNKMAAV